MSKEISDPKVETNIAQRQSFTKMKLVQFSFTTLVIVETIHRTYKEIDCGELENVLFGIYL